MPQILKKSLIKWSSIALLGVSAYFVGYFWGHQTRETKERQQQALEEAASPSLLEHSQQPGQLRELKERAH